MSETRHYVYLVRPRRPGFRETMTEQEREIIDRHFDHLKARHDRGRLLLAGPCLDASFGLVVFEADSEEEAREFMDLDPAVREGIFYAELHPFHVALAPHR
ncbi:MAG: hypothetical protein HYY93_03435 [Planctomycetes bacterium]|nr:hypothetical protein [Planctomycetota bacterium]